MIWWATTASALAPGLEKVGGVQTFWGDGPAAFLLSALPFLAGAVWAWLRGADGRNGTSARKGVE